MPQVPRPANEWFAQQLAQLKAQIAGLQATSTQYITDPTITEPSAGKPNCVVIIGDVSHDNFGNSTGLTGWGIASKSSGTWAQAGGGSASVGPWENLTFGTNIEEGSHKPMVRKEGNGILRFKGALKVKAGAKIVPKFEAAPVVAKSPIPFKGGGSGFLYCQAVRFVKATPTHEGGVVLEFEDGTADIRLAGGPELNSEDQVDLDGIALTLE